MPKWLSAGRAKTRLEEDKTTEKKSFNELEGRIWRETGLPEKEFIKVYKPLFQNIKEITGKLSGEEGGGSYYSQLLTEIFHAVKVRNAFIFPVSATPEEIIQKTEVYTYALVSGMTLYALSAILSTFEGKDGFSPLVEPNLTLSSSGGMRKGFDGAGLLLASKVIPKDGLRWLYQYEDVFLEWVTFSTKPEASVFFEIYTKVKKFGGSRAHEEDKTGSHREEKQAVKPSIEKADTSKSQITTAGSVSKGWGLVSILREAVGAGELTVNASDSYIFIDEQNRTLLLPDGLFSWLAEKAEIKSNTAKNQFCRLGLHSIKKNKKTYYGGSTESGQSVNGLLVDDHKALWGETTPVTTGMTMTIDSDKE